MYAELTDVMFSDDTKEIVFYSACLTMYRFSLLVSNSIIPQNMKRFKWHILPLVRALVCGKDQETLSSKAIEKSAQAVISKVGQHSFATTDLFSRAVEICTSMGEVTPDRLKRQAILNEMLAKI